MIWTTRPRSKMGGLDAIVVGSGPRILLLHGVGLRAEAWNPIIDELASRFCVIAPDMPGHGMAQLDRPLDDLNDYTSVFLPLLDQPVIVVGHSMGAMIACELARQVPKQVRALVALNAIFGRSDAAKAAVQARAAALDGQRVVDPAPTLERWFGDSHLDEREACQNWLTANDPTAYRSAYTVFAHEDGPTKTDLAQLGCPALFATGGSEANSTPAMSRNMARLAPKGTALVIEDAAHMMPMTHAAQVAGALTSWIDEVAA